ncbi:MAG TPA: glycosyltransferase [Nitriliruptorales bacterium]|nr:glycosyltransferase [Nitriliruptorales bacterium]
MPPIASVVIPAHDEEAVVGRCLDALLTGADPSELDIVVACNGCTDRTAEVAETYHGVRVLSIEPASKIAALNAGDRAARAYPRIYLDADAELTGEDARALAVALTDGDCLAAAPRRTMVLDDRSVAVRLYYRFSQRLPVFEEGFIGSGAYALSERGRARWGAWPDVVADDLLVLRSFDPHERRTVWDARVVVHPPKRFRQLLRRGVRVVRANRELGRVASPRLPAPPSGFRVAAAAALCDPRRWPDLVVFVSAQLLMRLGAAITSDGVRWNQDRSARAPAGRVARPERGARAR